MCLAQDNSGLVDVNSMPIISGKSTLAPTNDIQHHGGPVISTPQGVNVYVIWYGDWSSSSDTAAQSIVTEFIRNLGGSTYFNINTTYFDYSNKQIDPVRNRVNYIGSTTDNYSRGTALSNQDVGDIVVQTIASGKFPLDQNGAYFVITSADVDETSGFCTTYCAWHGFDRLTKNGFMQLDAFVGNPDRCPSGCAFQPHLPTPNNNVAGDAMVNLIAHELSETVTDPFGNAWYASAGAVGNENADLCVWTFGQTTTLKNGSIANVTLDDRNYLLQRIWVNALGGYCSLSWVNGAQ